LTTFTEFEPSGHGSHVSAAHCVDEPPGPTPAAAPSFEEVYAEHFEFVWRNLRRLGVAEGALRDSAQEVFLIVHRRLREFEGRGTLRAWLYSILRRVAADERRWRRRKQPPSSDQVALLIDTAQPGPERQLIASESLRTLLALLDTLEADKRDVLVLSDIEGMSAPEVAAALDLNVNTVYSRLRAARLEIRTALERQRERAGRTP
jgi:RNA polymerase sigma-70 factor (ECF subfamily)